MKTLIRHIPVRRLTRGFEIFHVHRFVFTRNRRSKPHPYYLNAKYTDGTRTIQIMRFEYWHRPLMAKKVRK